VGVGWGSWWGVVVRLVALYAVFRRSFWVCPVLCAVWCGALGGFLGEDLLGLPSMSLGTPYSCVQLCLCSGGSGGEVGRRLYAVWFLLVSGGGGGGWG